MARIVVVGGSLGGLLVSNLLLRNGHDVVVLEKSPMSLDGRGAGIVTHPPLLEALWRAKAEVKESLGVRVEGRRVLERSGAIAASCLLPQVLTSWGRLHQILLELLPGAVYHLGAEVAQIVQTSSSVVAHCVNGSQFEGDLLIASDGLRSIVRRQLAPGIQASYAGYVAWRGVCDEAVLSRFTLDSLFDYFGFCLPPGEQILGYPVAGALNCTAPGQRRYNFVWYRAAAAGRDVVELLSDDEGNQYPMGIPPHKVTTENLNRMRRDARALLAPQFVEVLEKTTQPFLQPIFDLKSHRLAFGRVALMGDAAFVARPHVGMGVTKAAEDAMALTESVAQLGANAKALSHYEQQRLFSGQAVVERGRELGAYMQSYGTKTSASMGSVERDAQRVLNETAVDFRTARAQHTDAAPSI